MKDLFVSDIEAEGNFSLIGQFISSVMGMAPLVVASSILNINLNSNYLEGYLASAFPRKAEAATISAVWNFTDPPLVTNPGTNPNNVATYGQLTAASHAPVTLGTANGLSLVGQALSLGLASASVPGALSATDWNTFNGKQAALSGTGLVKSTAGAISYITDNSANWNIAHNRWITTGSFPSDLNTTVDGGLKFWDATTSNRPPSSYGTLLTLVGVSGTGNGAATGTWINQLGITTTNNIYLRQSINNWSTWTGWSLIWSTSNMVIEQAWNITPAGLPRFNTSATNSPDGSTIYHGLFIPHSTSTTIGSEIAFRNGVGQFRSIEGGSWGSWRRFWSSVDFTSTDISNWNTSYGWGDYKLRTVSTGTGLTGGGTLAADRTLAFDTTWGDARYSIVSHTHTFASITSKPTTVLGYGITDILAQLLAGYSVGTNAAITAGDSILSAFQNIQGQLDAKSPTLSGTGIVKSTAGTISYITDNSAIWNTTVRYDTTQTLTAAQKGYALRNISGFPSTSVVLPNFALAYYNALLDDYKFSGITQANADAADNPATDYFSTLISALNATNTDGNQLLVGSAVDQFWFRTLYGGTFRPWYRVASREWVAANYSPVLSGTGIVKSTAGTISYLTDNTAKWNKAFPLSNTNDAVDYLYTGNVDSYAFSGATIVSLTATGTKPFSSTFGLLSLIYSASSPAGGQIAIGRNADEFAWRGHITGVFSAWNIGASQSWVSTNYSGISHTHTFASLTSKPTTVSGYGITDILSQVLTGYSVGANTPIASSDTILGAFQKIQGQLNSKSPTLSGTGLVKSTSGTISYITDNTANWNTAYGWGNHSGLYAVIGRQINGIYSITGGGDLTSNRNLQLVGDSSSPGNNKLYGTNGSGNKGWYDQPSGGGGGSVTSVGLSVPTGFDVTSFPVTSSGNLSFAFSSGYSLPSNSSQSSWNAKPSGSGSNSYFSYWNGSNSLASSPMYYNSSSGSYGERLGGRFGFAIQTDKSDYPGIHLRDVSYSESPISSALMQMDSDSRGFLVPRMTRASRLAISSPVTGLLVYQTDTVSASVPGFKYYTGAGWTHLETNNTKT